MQIDDASRGVRERQDRILAHVSAACLLVGQAPADARGPLSRARWELVRLLGDYQAFKHRELFDPAIRCGTPRQIVLAREMKDRCLTAAATYRDYVSRWSSTDVEAQWDDYRAAMLRMSGQLRAHIERERKEIGELLAGCHQPRIFGR